jgi:hypothetical protein
VFSPPWLAALALEPHNNRLNGILFSLFPSLIGNLYMYPVSFDLMTSSSTFLLWEEEVPYEIELID